MARDAMVLKEGLGFPFQFHLMPLWYKSVSAFVELDDGLSSFKHV